MRHLLSGLLIAISANAFAVDGVSLGNMFSTLTLLIWALIVGFSLKIVFSCVKRRDPVVRNRQFKRFVFFWVAGVTFPYGYAKLGSTYAQYLCKKEAAMIIFYLPTDWENLNRDVSLMRNNQFLGTIASSKKISSPPLIEFREITNHAFGAKQMANRLNDPNLGKDLLISNQYYTFGTMRQCGESSKYWILRHDFSRVSEIENRTIQHK